MVASEDAHFCKHHGIDFGALREAMHDAEDGEALRGASTITQQVAKNLFLWQAPGALHRVLDPIRKLFEFPLAIWIDLVLPKQRILEIYLNIAEMGPSGQFGAEAGSAYAFGHSAATLSPREAATAGLDPAESGQTQRPEPRTWRPAAGRDLHRAGQCRGDLLARKTRILSGFSAIFRSIGPSIAGPLPL